MARKPALAPGTVATEAEPLGEATGDNSRSRTPNCDVLSYTISGQIPVEASDTLSVVAASTAVQRLEALAKEIGTAGTTTRFARVQDSDVLGRHREAAKDRLRQAAADQGNTGGEELAGASAAN